MTFSRRRVLAALPAAAVALAACTPSEPRAVVNVRGHGASGDGIADDSAAIRAAVMAMKSGSTLYFPTGSYRFAELHPEGGAAIRLVGMSDLTIEFDDGAELVMDNVDPETNKGTCHGILIHGPASRIALRNVKIRWVARPDRSMGDGIRILGCPTDTDETPEGWDGPPAPVNGVELTNCEIRSSAQTGAILTGVSDVNVSRLRVLDTAADGLHFNACRRVKIDDYLARNNGDDGLALVTYYSDEPFFDSLAETFAFPQLTDWSNADFTVTNVDIAGGMANGVRLAGATRVSIDGLTVVGKTAGSGVITDSATVESDSIWHYVASRDILLNNVVVQNCSIGIHTLARPPASAVDARFTDFDVEIADATVGGCANWGVRLESLTEQRVTGLRLNGFSVDATSTEGGNGGVGLGNTKDITLGDVTVAHALPATTFFASNSSNLQIGSLQVTVKDTAGPEGPAPAPCALFEDSDGTISTMDVQWADAPTSWTPVLVRSAGAICGDAATAGPRVVIESLTVEPASVVNRIGDC
jgi:Pectate lyase superfamily protein